jgi:hypothetical protein
MLCLRAQVLHSRRLPDIFKEYAMYVLLACWYESDGYLVNDSFLAISASIDTLKNKAKEHIAALGIAKDPEIVFEDAIKDIPVTDGPNNLYIIKKVDVI